MNLATYFLEIHTDSLIKHWLKKIDDTSFISYILRLWITAELEKPPDWADEVITELHLFMAFFKDIPFELVLSFVFDFMSW